MHGKLFYVARAHLKIILKAYEVITAEVVTPTKVLTVCLEV